MDSGSIVLAGRSGRPGLGLGVGVGETLKSTGWLEGRRRTSEQRKVQASEFRDIFFRLPGIQKKIIKQPGGAGGWQKK